MIRGFDLFGREAISPNERSILKAANKTALNLYKKRFSPHLRDNWDIPVNDLTLEDVENDVIASILAQDPTGGRYYAKEII